MNKRVFVGIKVSGELAEKIVLWQKEQKVKNVRWTSKNNLHVTLVPPWYEKDIEETKIRLEKLDPNVSVFSISFKEILFGPTKKRPRLIWVQGPVPNELAVLKKKIEKHLGFAPEKRMFKFHITLGRFKEKDFGSISGKVKTSDVPWKMKVDSFHLFESRLSPQGAEYAVLQEIRLSRDSN